MLEFWHAIPRNNSLPFKNKKYAFYLFTKNTYFIYSEIIFPQILTRIWNRKNIYCCIELLFIIIFIQTWTIFGNFFVVKLKCRYVLSRFSKLPFFHSFSNIPMNKSSFLKHQVKLVIKSGPCFTYRRCVCQWTYSSGNFCKITPGYYCGWLIVYSNL